MLRPPYLVFFSMRGGTKRPKDTAMIKLICGGGFCVLADGIMVGMRSANYLPSCERINLMYGKVQLLRKCLNGSCLKSAWSTHLIWIYNRTTSERLQSSTIRFGRTTNHIDRPNYRCFVLPSIMVECIQGSTAKVVGAAEEDAEKVMTWSAG
jgi:hypothetical protein